MHHADPHPRILLDPVHGPFAGCDPLGGHLHRPSPATVPPPPELFDIALTHRSV
ncbi:hypothetical protein [Streptomyces sp. NPDC006463]|uniref:hypothetical protein n=1 Tax=Streptomyces sp. NPDC006463 TaxID=3364746 RepID=UPI0036BCEBDC